MQLKEQQLFDINLPKNQVFQICLSFLKKSLSFWPKFSLSFLHFSLSIFFAERKKKPGLNRSLQNRPQHQHRFFHCMALTQNIALFYSFRKRGEIFIILGMKGHISDLLEFLKKSLSFWPKFSLSFLPFPLSIFFAERKKKPAIGPSARRGRINMKNPGKAWESQESMGNQWKH